MGRETKERKGKAMETMTDRINRVRESAAVHGYYMVDLVRKPITEDRPEYLQYQVMGRHMEAHVEVVMGTGSTPADAMADAERYLA